MHRGQCLQREEWRGTGRRGSARKQMVKKRGTGGKRGGRAVSAGGQRGTTVLGVGQRPGNPSVIQGDI